MSDIKPIPNNSSRVIPMLVCRAGHVWTISARVEETSAGERDQRWSSIAEGKE